MIIYLIYGTYLLGSIICAGFVFIKVRQSGKFKAFLASILTVFLLALFYPIPIHGGFTFLFEIMIEELESQANQIKYEQKRDKKIAFLTGIESRFKGTLDFTILKQEVDSWYSVQVADGINAFYESNSKLLWRPAMVLEHSVNNPSLADAKEFCRTMPPQGYWTLPNEAEIYYFWKSGGQRIDPGRGNSYISFIVDLETQTEIQTMSIGRRREIAVRCIARSIDAPKRGYTNADISLSEWNTYQLEKMKANLF